MGLYDRDYMREERPRPPAGGRTATIAFIVVIVAMVYLFLKAHPRVLPSWAHSGAHATATKPR